MLESTRLRVCFLEDGAELSLEVQTPSSVMCHCAGLKPVVRE